MSLLFRSQWATWCIMLPSWMGWYLMTGYYFRDREACCESKVSVLCHSAMQFPPPKTWTWTGSFQNPKCHHTFLENEIPLQIEVYLSMLQRLTDPSVISLYCPLFTMNWLLFLFTISGMVYKKMSTLWKKQMLTFKFQNQKGGVNHKE